MARAPDSTRRQALALRAAEVLAQEGLSLPVERLAAALGMKRPTFLYHFPTYADVIEAALVAVLTEQAGVVLAALEAHTHPIDRLFAQMKAVHAFHHGKEARVVFLTQAIAATGGARVPEILARGATVFAAHRKAQADRVREGVREGTVAPCDADALVETMRAITDGLMVQRMTDGTDLAKHHALVWQFLLAPLKLTPKTKAARRATDKPKPRKHA